MSKVLIISHNTLRNDTNNGRTLIEFFKNWDNDSIAQLYLYKELPKADFCKNYYRITDFDIVDSLIKFKKPGKKINLNNIETLKINEKKIYQNGSKKKPVMKLMRNIIWGLNTWNNKKLKLWLDSFKPDVIFYFASDSIFSHKIALKISKMINIPLVSFWCDDYYFDIKKNNNLIEKFNNFQFKKSMRKLIENSTYICLSELMQNSYEKEFHKNGNCIYTASSLESSIYNYSQKNKLIISFIGNISCKRYEGLLDIAKVIYDNNLPIELNVYTGETRKWNLDNIININGLNYKGEIDYEQVKNVIKESDILLHIESFDQEMRKRVKYSFSTKIADSLSSGRCLFAYGPEEVASIDYLIKNECAIVAKNKDELEVKLKEIIDNKKILYDTIAKSLNISKINHNVFKNQEKFIKIINDLM